MYADDSQLYKASGFSDLNPSSCQTALSIEDVKLWMDSNKLQFNNDKTELKVFKNKVQIKEHIQASLNINECNIVASSKVKNLGVIFDEDLSLKAHVNSVYSSIIFQLSKISSIRNHIKIIDVAKTLVTSLILSRLDYCNSLFCNMSHEYIDKLQLVQNHAARLIFRAKKRDHVKPLLFKLHWLPIEFRIKYKIAVLCFKCLHKTAPLYLQNLIEIYVPRRALRSSNDSFKLVKPSMKYKSYGERSLSFYGPFIWNDLPHYLRSCDSLEMFKKNLKTFYFRQAYDII